MGDNKSSKRIKIDFESINGDNYTVIPPDKVAESNTRIKEEMKKFKKPK